MTSAFGVKLSSADSCRNPLWRVAADAVQDSHFYKNTRENSAIEFGIRGQKGRVFWVGYVRTSNPNSASRISSSTFFSIVRRNDNVGFETECVNSVENCGVPVFADASVVGDGAAYHCCGEEGKELHDFVGIIL